MFTESVDRRMFFLAKTIIFTDLGTKTWFSREPMYPVISSAVRHGISLSIHEFCFFRNQFCVHSFAIRRIKLKRYYVRLAPRDALYLMVFGILYPSNNLNNHRNSFTKVIERNIEFVTYYFYKPTFKYIRNYHIGLSKLLTTK